MTLCMLYNIYIYIYIYIYVYNIVHVLVVCRYGFTFEDSDPTFNAGVYGINFDLWRSRNVHDEVQYWLDEVSPEFKVQPKLIDHQYRCYLLFLYLLHPTASQGATVGIWYTANYVACLVPSVGGA